MNPQQQSVVVSLSPQEILQLEVLLTDHDAEGAFTFLQIVYERVQARIRLGLRSHLDR